MTDNSFTKFVPGFEFLQGLVKNAGSALPGIGQWVAPTLNPEELSKRIEELRTVQFWLEQNARMLGATIQALEVQRMTLSTLKTMNVPLAELHQVLKVPEPSVQATAERAKSSATSAAKPAAKTSGKGRGAAVKSPAAAAVDPMQWWSALGQQFTQLASNAVKDQAADVARHLAGAAIMPGTDSAGTAPRKAAAMPGAGAGAAAKASRPAAKKSARKTTRSS